MIIITRSALLAALSAFVLVGCQPDAIETSVVEQPKVTATAELISLKNATLGPPSIPRMWQYKIEYMARENQLVKEGDKVLVFDAQNLKNDLISQSSRLAAEIKKAENQKLKDEATQQDLILALAEAEMNFQKAKRKAEITDASRSKIERDKQQADYEYQTENLAQAKQKLAHHKKAMEINRRVDQAEINQRQSRVNSVKRDIAKLTINAPKDGLVMYTADWEGEKAAVGQTVYMGRTLMQLPSLDEVAIKAEFAEPDTAKLHTGQVVKVIFEAYPENAYMGKISELGEAYYPKSTSNAKVVFDALIELDDNKPEVMRPGMKAKVEVLGS
ncbi:MAG: efflux RND transporter periplasmic adaptor subunit [Paraglaciecola sp.]|uniref:HlyD family secretion protein n=1 Tax=Paraglaciecola sp. TaxID=1920173 RepID=UPI00273F93E5|nr:efflux RND transporter periplasmic adaptor subunit [Paraglaciecola sp.]MDP5031362.1 efflux RND transporter periplasmic adaptor subunit [Paraglaciecola sp.]MDP5132284.1 efflux RND transporter periplasmic adaptor subunit [Paraglaciecola sp.]